MFEVKEMAEWKLGDGLDKSPTVMVGDNKTGRK